MKLLTDEQIKQAYRSCNINSFFKSLNGFEVEKALCQAQLDADLKAIYEWGNEDCPHNGQAIMIFYDERGVLEKSPLSKRECLECWQELRG